MWRFIEGVSEPVSKKPRTPEEIRIAHANYDKTMRDRKFLPKWLNEFSWLEYRLPADGGEIKKMFCKICVQFAASGRPTGSSNYGTFVTGNATFKIESVKAHDESVGHKNNVTKTKYGSNSSTTSPSPALNIVKQLNEHQYLQISRLFRNAHFVAKMSCPYTHYNFLWKLDHAKSLDVGKTYLNEKQGQIFIHYIALQERVKLKKLLAGAPFISIMSDGSTDSSVQEAEMVYIRFSNQGVIYTKFVGIENVPKADARTICNAILSVLNTSLGPNAWKTKVVGTGTDGAAVMLGKANGVVKLLKDELNAPYIQAVHCSAHRLELAYRDTCKNIPLYQKLETFLLNLYYFYKNSPLQRANLKESYVTLGRRPLMPTRTCGTRWVEHVSRAIRNVVKGYQPFVQHLEQIHSQVPKAKFLMQFLVDQECLRFMLLILDVTDCLQTVSQEFQKRSTTVGQVATTLETAKHILEEYKNSDGPKLQLLKADGTSFDDTTLTLRKTGKFTTSREKMLPLLIECLENRFESDEHVMRSSSSILNFKLWPQTLTEAKNFGDADVHFLATTFEVPLMQADAEQGRPLVDWIKLKVLIYKSFPREQIQSLTWERLNTAFREDCPCILTLVDLLLSLPSSSAEAERGFSIMKMTKTDKRNCLKSSSLSDLLLIKLESPEIAQFDPTPALDLWLEDGPGTRRPSYMDARSDSEDSEAGEDDPPPIMMDMDPMEQWTL